MLYSPKGTAELMDWASAAKHGGIASGVDVSGKPRTYAVSAWLELPGKGLVDVTDVPLSTLDETISRVWRKELDLPITKPLVYKRADKACEVEDVVIVGVWDGWCTLLVTVKGGYKAKVHSMYFAEMNKSSSISSIASIQSGVEQKPKGTPLGDDYPLTFIVFDLETTSNNPNDADICEMAAVYFDKGIEKNRISTLVHIDGEMPWKAENIHHISRSMLENEPHMTQCLKEFLNFVGDDAVIVGHNILTFDIPILNRVADACGMSFTYARAIDTLSLARDTWPKLPSHKMDKLRPILHLDDHGAHRALKDCYDEAKLYLTLYNEIVNGVKTDLSAFPSETDSNTPKRRRATQSAILHKARWKNATTKKAKDFVPSVSSFDTGHPLYMKCVAITGDLLYGTREVIMQRICNLGGTPQDNVTMKTNYLVVGDNSGRSKIEKAKRYRETKGIPIEIISANEFERLLEA